jgi:hypothetical protein
MVRESRTASLAQHNSAAVELIEQITRAGRGMQHVMLRRFIDVAACDLRCSM